MTRVLLAGLLMVLVGCTQAPTATTEPPAPPDSSTLTLSVAEVREITPPALESEPDFDLHKPYTPLVEQFLARDGHVEIRLRVGPEVR